LYFNHTRRAFKKFRQIYTGCGTRLLAKKRQAELKQSSPVKFVSHFFKSSKRYKD